ncbi:MAG: L-fuconate dehydratase [Bacteroidota bacterium]
MSIQIIDLETLDIRFPTSDFLDGSDAMNPDPDYSAAYVVLKTNKPGLEGHGLTFTIGRGNELCVKAIDAMRHLLVGQYLKDITADMAGFWRSITGDSQLRWLGPDKGVIHLATGALVNAVWDLYAKFAEKPLWRLLADMSPEELLSCIDFTYLTDVLNRDEAYQLLLARENGKQDRIATLIGEGYPAYTTSAGWLGYSDEKIVRLCKEALQEGWKHMKMKVGSNIEEDLHRAALIRSVIGDQMTLMMDANQKWEVSEAITHMKRLAAHNPYWIEEPTSPDDVLGHQKIKQELQDLGIKVATGEHCQNRILFKQFIASGAIDICQIDSCRVGGVNEILAILLIAAKYNVPVCPHAGGVGLCEYVQHLSMLDYCAISGTREGRMIEYVDHLHEHFKTPVKIEKGFYTTPLEPGYSITMKRESLAAYEYPKGSVWKKRIS